MDSRSPQHSVDAVLIRTLLVLLAIAGLHTVLTWGYLSDLFGDYGVGLHQIERFARGDTPYADFFLQFPPLSVWIIGTFEALTSTDVTAFWVATATIYILIAAAYAWYVHGMLPRDVVLGVAVAAFVLAIPFASIESPPFPVGMYTPSVPVGTLFMLVTLGALLRAWESEQRVWPIILGVFASFCVLTKQDFWPPAAAATLAATVRYWTSGRRSHLIPLLGAMALTMAAGLAVIAVTAGPSTILRIAGGGGMASAYGVGRLLPSWERVTAELIALSLHALWVSACLYVTAQHRAASGRSSLVAAAAAVVFLGVYAVMSKRSGIGSARLAAESSVHRHALPLLLSWSLLIVLWIRSRAAPRTPRIQLVLWLLLIVASARLRRGFERVEGFQILFELPVYVLAAETFLGSTYRRALAITLPAVVVLGLYSYHKFENGPFTWAGTEDWMETLRGPVRLDAGVGYDELLATLDSIDPGRERPIFSFGHNGGMAYFLDRRNPSSATFGLQTSYESPQSTADSVMRVRPPPILVYVPEYEGYRVPEVRLSFTTWEQPTMLNHYMAHDYAYFQAMISTCREVAVTPRNGRPYYGVYDCP